MPWNYDPAEAGIQALHWVRLTVGDIKSDRQLQQDEEIGVSLAEHDLLLNSPPSSANLRACRLAAAKVCDRIAAFLASKSEIVMTGVGAVKSTAAELYRKMGQDLRSQANKAVAPSWQNHEVYPTTHIFGEDPLPTSVAGGASRTLNQSS